MNLDQQNMREKPFWNKDTLSKDASHSLACFHEKPLSDSCFRHILQLKIKHVATPSVEYWAQMGY